MSHKFIADTDEYHKRYHQTMSFIDYTLKKILKEIQQEPDMEDLTLEQLKQGIHNVKIEQNKLIIKFDENKLACMIGSPLHVTEFTIKRKDNNIQEIDDQ